MSSHNELLQQAGESFEYANQYVQKQVDLFKLESAERIAKTTSSLVTAAVLFMIATLVIIMLSITVGIWLGSLLGTYSGAFLIVTGLYTLAGLLVYFFREQLVTNPVLSNVLESFFE